ncbi:hypothetical protein BI347_18965 [Chromobacterium sphagni]|uniref:Uncharacterized protein n=1 Tax=Chromobacterium sphagni TaxID=1903179 RepID=A0A1S1WTJ5_9NEIS|nr:hypothetical protein [Chromobacterium sphagni]OHX10612.1 hypothetical protein BI347_18965 [Chromobacterium sphagni]
MPVLADSFQVALPDGTNPKPVFSVTRINGQPAVGVDGSLIADGTIVGRRVIALDSIDAGQINSRGLTIRDQAGSVVVDMTGMGAGYIKGRLTVGQIDTESLRITRNGAVVVDANGLDATYIRNLMVDTLQIRGEAVSKNDTRSITVNGWTNAFNYSFQFSCSDSGTLLAFADSPFADPVATLYGRNRSVPVNGSAVLVLNVNAGEVVTVGVSSPAIQKSGVIRYGCVLSGGRDAHRHHRVRRRRPHRPDRHQPAGEHPAGRGRRQANPDRRGGPGDAVCARRRHRAAPAR